MTRKTKTIAIFMAMCLVLTLGVLGIFAVKTLNMSVGGNIAFAADGISVTVSAGEFKTLSGTPYTSLTTQEGVTQGFVMNTNTKLSEVKGAINSWKGLTLEVSETLGVPVLHFTITNNMEGEVLAVKPTITLGTNKNNNMDIVMTPSYKNLQPNQAQEFTITFEIDDMTINAGLQGFLVSIEMSKAVVEDLESPSNSSINFAPIQGEEVTYKIQNCSNASGDVVLPAYVKQDGEFYPVTEIADNAFNDNTNIETIVIPNTVTKIGEFAFFNSGLKGKLIIPDAVEYIGTSAFYSCSGLTSVEFGKGLETVREYAFQNCSGITSVTLGDSLKTVGDYAFSKCAKLTTVTIGSGVTQIGGEAFCISKLLTSIVIMAENPPTVGRPISLESTTKIYVPAQSVDAYKTAQYWSDYADVIEAIPA